MIFFACSSCHQDLEDWSFFMSSHVNRCHCTEERSCVRTRKNGPEIWERRAQPKKYCIRLWGELFSVHLTTWISFKNGASFLASHPLKYVRIQRFGKSFRAPECMKENQQTHVCTPKYSQKPKPKQTRPSSPPSIATTVFFMYECMPSRAANRIYWYKCSASILGLDLFCFSGPQIIQWHSQHLFYLFIHTTGILHVLLYWAHTEKIYFQQCCLEKKN